ncbi:MAG: ribonucleoside hydrolase RihC [Clostridium sp.]|nr:ribonucleoside hydrolase RihC [Clostridium sp.]
MRYLMDLDPGADDVFAMLIALKENLNIKGIITVSGNVPINKVTYNALGLLKLVGKNIPVCKGSSSPIVKESFTASDVHGDSGIGDLILPDGKENLVPDNFIDFYLKKLYESERKTTIIALGPLTNIALLYKTHPEVKDKIEEIIFMGGSISEGNVTPYAEFNAYVDPESYQILFDSGIKMVMVGLDATHKSLLKIDEIENLDLFGEVGVFTKKLLIWYCKNVMKTFGYPGCHMHDPSTIMYILRPDIFTYFHAKLDISTNNDITRAHIMVDKESNSKNIKILNSLNNELFKDEFFKILKKYNK